MKIVFIINLIVLILSSSGHASPAAHVQKNIATIIGSNVEVNIDVPSEFSLVSGENKSEENQEKQRIVLDIKSNIDTGSNDENVFLEKLLDQATNIEENEGKKEHEHNQESSLVSGDEKTKDESDGDVKKKEEPWQKYLKKRDYWRNYRAANGNGTEVEDKNGNIINILNLIGELAGYAIKIVTSYLSGNYLDIIKYVFSAVELIVNYIFNRK